MKTVLPLLALVVALAFACTVEAQSTTPIGAILPLTGDGAFWGENPKHGIELALEDLKSNQHITNIRFIIEDDRCSAKDAVTAFHKLVEVDRVKIILGPACSSAAAAVAPLAEKSRVLLLPFAESDEVKTGPYVRRLWVPNSIQGRRLAQYAFDQHYRSIAVLATQNAFGTSISKAFSEHFTRLGGKIVAHQDYEPSATSFRSELLRLKAADPDALFFASYIKDGAILVREAQELGIAKPLLGPSTINSPEFFETTKGSADGLVLADLNDSSTTEFRERWESTFGSKYPGIASGAALFYDVATILSGWLQKNAIAGTGDFLRSIDYSGASGRIKFTSDGNLDRRHVHYRVNEGKLELLLTSDSDFPQ